MYVLDLWRAQASADKWIEAFCDLVQYWKPIGWAEEQGQIKAGVGPFLERRMRERAAYVARAQFPTRGDKAVRAQSIRGRMELDGLYVPTLAPWYADFRAELLSFPAGKYDDQVDGPRPHRPGTRQDERRQGSPDADRKTALCQRNDNGRGVAAGSTEASGLGRTD